MEGKLYIVVSIVLCLAWQAQAQAQVQGVNCVQTGAGRYPNPFDTTCKNYTLCVALNNLTGTYLTYNYICPGTSLFNPATSQCTTNYVCNAVAPNPTTQCTVDGFIANPNSVDCTTYIQCLLVNGVFNQFPLACPQGSFFNPATTLCEINYVCPFTCNAAGRFPGPANTNCRNYYLCVANANGAFTRFEYICPLNSVFNPNTNVCSTTYICPV